MSGYLNCLGCRNRQAVLDILREDHAKMVPLAEVIGLPLRETILAVLRQMPSEAAPEHLAVQIESQVRGWFQLQFGSDE